MTFQELHAILRRFALWEPFPFDDWRPKPPPRSPGIDTDRDNDSE